MYSQRKGLRQAKLNFSTLGHESAKDISSPSDSAAPDKDEATDSDVDSDLLPFTSVDVENNPPTDDIPHIVSQLCSSECNLTSFMSNVFDPALYEQVPCAEPRIPGLSFLDDYIPLALAAGTNSNPDTLSQRDMLKAIDKDKFLQCQPDEINGLHDANVFHYMRLDDIPPQ